MMKKYRSSSHVDFDDDDFDDDYFYSEGGDGKESKYGKYGDNVKEYKKIEGFEEI